MTRARARTLEPGKGGRRPLVDDETLLAAMPATVEQLTYVAKVSASTVSYRLKCLSMEGRASVRARDCEYDVMHAVWVAS